MNQRSTPLVLNSSDMTSNITSQGIELINTYAFSIQLNWSSGTSPVGTFKLQASNDPGNNGSGQGVSQPTNWTDVGSSSVSVSGTPGSLIYDVTECGYRWVRLIYTAGSGSATLNNAVINTKGV